MDRDVGRNRMAAVVMDPLTKATEALLPHTGRDLRYPESRDRVARAVLDAVGYPAHQSSDEGTCWCPVAEQAGRERDAAVDQRDSLQEVAVAAIRERDTLAATVRALESERAGATSTAKCGCRVDGRGRTVHLCAGHYDMDARKWVVMDADLTCPTCGGEGKVRPPMPYALYGRWTACPDCAFGRRPPTLTEWDTLRAERDRLSEILGEAEDMLAEFHESIGRYVPDGVSVLLAERDRYREALERTPHNPECAVKRSPWLGRVVPGSPDCDCPRAALDAEEGP